MATFLYRAYNEEGLRFSGSKRLNSEEMMKEFLDKKNLVNYTIYKSETMYSTDSYKIVSPKELAIFCRQMSVLFFSHITLMEGIVLLSQQTENKQLKLALDEIYAYMEQGYTFAESVCMYEHIFGSYLLNMVTIGEASGTLDQIFSNMANYFDKESKTRKKMKSAVTYPAILSVLMGAIIVLLIVKILPMFESILKRMGGEMPGITKVILTMSAFVNNYLAIVIILIIAIIVGIRYYSKTPKGEIWMDKMKMSIPISRYIYSRVITARVARSLGILLKSGVQLLNALEEVKNLVDNSYIKEKFEKCILEVKDGNDLAESLGKIGVFPPLFLKMVVIGQTTGHLDEMLEKSADIFDTEVDESLERLTVLIEPVLIIILSLVVGVILVSVMLPMIDIMNKIG